MNWSEELNKPVGYLSNGKMVTLRELMKLRESDWKSIGSGEPSDPIIGDKAMKGRRWKIDWDANGKSYDKITKPTSKSKVLPYNKFVKEIVSSSDADTIFDDPNQKALGFRELYMFYTIAKEPEKEKVNLLLKSRDRNDIREAWRLVIDVLKNAGKLMVGKLEENTMKYKDFFILETVNEMAGEKFDQQTGESFSVGARVRKTAGRHIHEPVIIKAVFPDVREANVEYTDGTVEKVAFDDLKHEPGLDEHCEESTCPCGCTDTDKCDSKGQCVCECGMIGETGKKWIQKAVHPARKGMFDNKTVEDLNKMKSALHKKNDAQEEQGKPVPHANKVAMSQINFALRAKKHKLVKEDSNLPKQWCGSCEQEKPVTNKSEIGAKDWICSGCSDIENNCDMYRTADEPTGWDEGKINEDGLTVNKMDHTIDPDHTKNCNGARRNGSRISIG